MPTYDFRKKEFGFRHVLLLSVILHFVVFLFYPFQSTKIIEPDPIVVELIDWKDVPKSAGKPSAKRNAPKTKKSKPRQPVPKTVAPKPKPVTKPTLKLPTSNDSLPKSSLSESVRLSTGEGKPAPIPENFPTISSPSDLTDKLGRLSDPPIATSLRQGETDPSKFLQDKENSPGNAEAPLNSFRSSDSSGERGDGAFADLKSRKILYKPRAPTLNADDNTMVTFQVAVNAGGDVIDVIPLKKGNAELERIGKAYILQFKFEPLIGRGQQVGIMRLKVLRGKIE